VIGFNIAVMVTNKKKEEKSKETLLEGKKENIEE